MKKMILLLSAFVFGASSIFAVGAKRERDKTPPTSSSKKAKTSRCQTVIFKKQDDRLVGRRPIDVSIDENSVICKLSEDILNKIVGRLSLLRDLCDGQEASSLYDFEIKTLFSYAKEVWEHFFCTFSGVVEYQPIQAFAMVRDAWWIADYFGFDVTLLDRTVHEAHKKFHLDDDYKKMVRNELAGINPNLVRLAKRWNLMSQYHWSLRKPTFTDQEREQIQKDLDKIGIPLDLGNLEDECPRFFMIDWDGEYASKKLTIATDFKVACDLTSDMINAMLGRKFVSCLSLITGLGPQIIVTIDQVKHLDLSGLWIKNLDLTGLTALERLDLGCVADYRKRDIVRHIREVIPQKKDRSGNDVFCEVTFAGQCISAD